MAERDGAAVDVEPVQIHAQFLGHRQRLCALRLVDLEAADVIQLQSRALQQQADGRRGAEAQDLGRYADRRRADDAG